MNFKRITATLTATVMAGVLLCTTAFFAEQGDKTLEDNSVYVPYLPSEYKIKVDGKMDDIWYSIDPTPINRLDDLSDKLVDCDTTAQFRACWTDKGFYAIVEVDKHGDSVVTDASAIDPDYQSVGYAIDCVQIAFVSCIDAYPVHPSDSNVFGFNGGATPDYDGNRNMCGWYFLYADDYLGREGYDEPVCQAVVKQTADDKYITEYYFDWIRPLDPKVYGVAGIGNGYYFTVDFFVHNQNSETGERSVITWNSYPNFWGNNACFGWFMLSDEPEYVVEFDPSKVPATNSDPTSPDDTADVIPSDETPTGDVTGNDDTPNGEKKTDEKKDNDGKKDNSPKTLDIASVVATASVLTFGAALIIKKKHR